MINLFAAVVQRFGQVDVRLAALAVCFHLANHVLRSVAWRNVLAAAYPDRRVRLLDIGAAYAIGVALNAVLPGRGGDAAKVLLARTRVPGSTVPTIAATMSVIVLFDMVAATVLVLVVLPDGSHPVRPQRAVAERRRADRRWRRRAAWPWRSRWRRRASRRACAPSAEHVAQGGAILKTPRRYAPPGGARAGGRLDVPYRGGLLPARRLRAARLRPDGRTRDGRRRTLDAGAVDPRRGRHAAGHARLRAAPDRRARRRPCPSRWACRPGVTVVNALLGVAAAMVAFRTLRPLAAVRSGLGLLGAREPA